jgi:hypothetical protein
LHIKYIYTPRRPELRPEGYSSHGPSASVGVEAPEGRPRGRQKRKCVYVGADAPFVGVGYS